VRGEVWRRFPLARWTIQFEVALSIGGAETSSSWVSDCICRIWHRTTVGKRVKAIKDNQGFSQVVVGSDMSCGSNLEACRRQQRYVDNVG